MREGRVQVAPQAPQHELLRLGVGDVGLAARTPRAPELAVDMGVEDLVEHLDGVVEVLGADPGPGHERLPEGHGVARDARRDDSLALGCLLEEARVHVLEHVVHERALLHPREVGIGVAEPEAAQGEPLVGTLEVGLDLGCRERGIDLDGAVARHQDESLRAL